MPPAGADTRHTQDDVADQDGKLALILFVDRTCVELFSQDGLMYAPVAAIADPKLETITWTVVAGQAKAVRGSAHALRSIWP